MSFKANIVHKSVFLRSQAILSRQTAPLPRPPFSSSAASALRVADGIALIIPSIGGNA